MNLKQIEKEALHPSEKDETFAKFPYPVISDFPPSPLAGEGGVRGRGKDDGFPLTTCGNDREEAGRTGRGRNDGEETERRGGDGTTGRRRNDGEETE